MKTHENANSFLAVNVAHYSSGFGTRLLLLRGLWGVVWMIFFRLSPRWFFGWRRMLLRAFGAKVGFRSVVYPSTWIWAPWNLCLGDYACLGPHVDCYSVDKVYIGHHATVSQNATLCTASHDIADPGMRLITSPIRVESFAWIAAGAFIHPGRIIGEGGVVAAMSCLVKDVGTWEVHGGNPAKFIKVRRLDKS